MSWKIITHTPLQISYSFLVKCYVLIFQHYLARHKIGEYQCLYCVYGTNLETSMKIHLCYKHPEMVPKAFHRVPCGKRFKVSYMQAPVCLTWDDCVSSKILFASVLTKFNRVLLLTLGNKFWWDRQVSIKLSFLIHSIHISNTFIFSGEA